MSSALVGAAGELAGGWLLHDDTRIGWILLSWAALLALLNLFMWRF